MQHGSTLEQLTRLVKDLGVAPQESEKPTAAYRWKSSEGVNVDVDYIQKVLDDCDVDYSIKEKPGLRIYTLYQCPFNSTHKQSAFIVNTQTGQTGFHCFHNSCSEYKFRDAVAKIGSNCNK